MDNEYESYLKEHAEADSTRFQSLASKEVLSLRRQLAEAQDRELKLSNETSRLKGALEIAGKEGEKLLQRIAALDGEWHPAAEPPPIGKKVLIIYDGACVEDEPTIAALTSDGLWQTSPTKYLDRVYTTVKRWYDLPPAPPEV